MSAIDRLDLIPPVAPSTVGDTTAGKAARTGTDPVDLDRTADFERALDNFLDTQGPPTIDGLPASGQVEAPAGQIEFSRHALARLKSRGIEFSPQEMAEISDAVDRLAEKGVRESLVLFGDNALIVGVPKRTVITAMTRNEAVGSIFTNIDSTLVLK
jgi:flagellar operon protein